MLSAEGFYNALKPLCDGKEGEGCILQKVVDPPLLEVLLRDGEVEVTLNRNHLTHFDLDFGNCLVLVVFPVVLFRHLTIAPLAYADGKTRYCFFIFW